MEQLLIMAASGQPKIVSGTIKFVNQTTTYLLAVIAVVVIAMVLWQILKYLQADENDRIGILKSIKKIVIGGVLALVVDGTITYVSSFFR